MAINLLIGAGASVSSNWVRVEPAKSVDYPIRISFVSHNWAGGNVILEELIGGLPGNGNSPYPPSSDTGTAKQIQQVGSGDADVIINAPLDFLRARTDANVTGTVDVFVTMDS